MDLLRSIRRSYRGQYWVQYWARMSCFVNYTFLVKPKQNIPVQYWAQYWGEKKHVRKKLYLVLNLIYGFTMDITAKCIFISQFCNSKLSSSVIHNHWYTSGTGTWVMYKWVHKTRNKPALQVTFISPKTKFLTVWYLDVRNSDVRNSKRMWF